MLANYIIISHLEWGGRASHYVATYIRLHIAVIDDDYLGVAGCAVVPFSSVHITNPRCSRPIGTVAMRSDEEQRSGQGS